MPFCIHSPEKWGLEAEVRQAGLFAVSFITQLFFFGKTIVLKNKKRLERNKGHGFN